MRTVHPRVCGEHAASAAGAIRFTGSSPRVRGTPRLPPAAKRRNLVVVVKLINGLVWCAIGLFALTALAFLTGTLWVFAWPVAAGALGFLIGLCARFNPTLAKWVSWPRPPAS